MTNIERAKGHQPKKLLTLAFARREGEILLAMKLRGFGEGWWNGYGGKLEAGESIEEALEREIGEESGGLVPDQLQKRGTIWFEFDGKAEILETHVFEIVKYHGEEGETEEMRPEWFPIGGIPYDKMWPTDCHWIPVFLTGKRFEAYFHLTADKELYDDWGEIVEL